MIGRRSILGLSLLGAIAIFAFTAQSAFAVEGWSTNTNTTAYTCVKGATEDFSDAHCDNQVTAGTGEYGHEQLPAGETTEITISNEGTTNNTTEAGPAVLESTLFGVNVKLTAQGVHGLGWIRNNEPSAGEHTVTGRVVVEYTLVSVSGLKNCSVEEPIEVDASFKGVDNGSGAMGVEFEAAEEGNPFTKITFTGSKCALNGVTIPVEGTAVGTGGAGSEANNTGATTLFEGAHEELHIGGSPATFKSETTTRMVNGNAISLTTAT